jgi:hypothetical protein
VNAATRRALTGAQLTTILAAIRAVDTETALLPTVLAHVYDALLHNDGRRLADLQGAQPISPEDWHIPLAQWDRGASTRVGAQGVPRLADNGLCFATAQPRPERHRLASPVTNNPPHHVRPTAWPSARAPSTTTLLYHRPYQTRR